MNESQDIKKALEQILDLDQPFQWFIPAIIKSVNGNLCDVSPVNGEADITDVRLASETDATDFIITPTVGSVVIVGMIDQTMGVVVMFGKIDSIKIRGDQYGGLIKIEELVTKINNLEKIVNDLITKYNAHTHILTLSAGTGTAAVTTSIETGTLTPTQKADIENDKIKHG